MVFRRHPFWRSMALMSGPFPLVLLCCCLGVLTVPAFLLAAIRFPAQGLRIASSTVLVHTEVTYRPVQIVLSESGPSTQTPKHRLLLDGKPVAPPLDPSFLPLEGLEPGPHTLTLEAQAGRHIARHTVTFSVVQEPTPWYLRFLKVDVPVEQVPLYWELPAEPVGYNRETITVLFSFARAALPSDRQETLGALRGLLIRLDTHGAATLAFPDGSTTTVTETNIQGLQGEPVQPPPGWYRALLWESTEETVRLELQAARFWRDGMPFALPEALYENSWADEEALFHFYDAYALGMPAIFALSLAHPEQADVWPPPIQQGRLIGPGYWLAPDGLYMRRLGDAQWERLPRPPAVVPETVLPPDSSEDPFLDISSTEIQARRCGDALWFVASWLFGPSGPHGVYLARYRAGQWERLTPPASEGRFFLYCIAGEPWLLNLGGESDRLESHQFVQWGWFLNREDPRKWGYRQGLGRTYRYHNGTWQDAVAPPLVNPWVDVQAHPWGPVLRVYDAARGGVWFLVPGPFSKGE